MDSKTEKFIKKAVALHGDKYSYETVNYSSAKEKVKIKCHIHGYFFQSPTNHLSERDVLNVLEKKELIIKEWVLNYFLKD